MKNGASTGRHCSGISDRGTCMIFLSGALLIILHNPWPLQQPLHTYLRLGYNYWCHLQVLIPRQQQPQYGLGYRYGSSQSTKAIRSLDSSRQNSNSSHVRFRLAEIVPAGFEMNFGTPKFTFTLFFLLCEWSGFFCTDWHERCKFFPVIRAKMVFYCLKMEPAPGPQLNGVVGDLILDRTYFISANIQQQLALISRFSCRYHKRSNKFKHHAAKNSSWAPEVDQMLFQEMPIRLR